MEKIPKIIHYCWFGGNPLPDSAQKCIDSWKKYLPDYQIREWNESNYNIEKCEFVKEAYAHQNWAFVTDYARLDVVCEFGGIYLDTDVEIVRSFDELLENEAFAGFDDDQLINTGMGFGARPHNPVIRANKDAYHHLSFCNADGSLNLITCPRVTSEILARHGAKMNNTFQKLEHITLYPKEYFCPLNYYTGVLHITDNTFSIHHFSMSWMEQKDIQWHNIHAVFSRILGKKLAFITVYGIKFVCFILSDAFLHGPRHTIAAVQKKWKKSSKRIG